MKRVSCILIIFLLIMMGFEGCKQSGNQSDGLITVNVTETNYPKKELVLQDFMDVEYILLETNDDFLNQGFVQAIGKEIILVTNRNRDGDIFLFDRKTGKGLRKINRMGQGGEEYSNITGIILDENNGEIFVNTSAKKIIVYDLYGKYKRSFKHTEGASYSDIFNYNKDNLFCYDYSEYYNNGEDRGKSHHVIISKQDGSITREIQIPFKTIITPVVRMGEGTAALPLLHIIPFHGNWVLVETSSDTVYNYTPDGSINPFIVRTPSIHAMDTEVFLSVSILTDRYCFMGTHKNKFDFEKGTGFPTAGLMYDKQENAIFDYTVYTNNYTEKRPVSMDSRPINDEIATCHSLEAFRLVESYKKGELKGKLKEIAATLDAEDNPVIMLIKHKK